jgi:uncharacterized protein (TIGR02001 family)
VNGIDGSTAPECGVANPHPSYWFGCFIWALAVLTFCPAVDPLRMAWMLHLSLRENFCCADAAKLARSHRNKRKSLRTPPKGLCLFYHREGSMKQMKVLSAVGLLALAGAAHADVTSTVTVATDYDYRGFSQTLNDAALQISIDYSHSSGWYVGTWGSNIDENFFSYSKSPGVVSSAQTEVDLYTGFKFGAGDVGFDAGLTYYSYAGASDFNFAEAYFKASYKIVSGGVFYSNDFGGKATGDTSDSAYYVYADLGIPAGPLTIALHGGYSGGDGIEQAVLGTADDSAIDLSLGLVYSGSNFTTSLKWITVDGGDYGSDDRIVLSVATTIPWAE